ncbi:MAG: bactofilin family protein [Deferrisomatales bacterium]
MWKRAPESTFQEPDPQPPTPEPHPRTERPEPRRIAEAAAIGPSITIQGDVTGEEDLVVHGRIVGKVDLKEHRFTVGASGRVKADVHARVVTVEGEVEGSLLGGEQVVLRKSARVRGDILAPRVTVEDGAVFKGTIDMEVKGQARGKVTPIGASAKRPGAEGGASPDGVGGEG